MRKLIYILLSLFFFVGCKWHQAHKPVEKNTIAAVKPKPVQYKGSPKIQFLTPRAIDFETIADGEVLVFTFVLKNTGSAPLIFKDVETSCGCTVANLSKRFVRPGDTVKIVVNFDSSGFSGEQYKIVTLYTNAKDRDSVVHITIYGRVKPQ
jgi:hypothetical protein